MIKKLLVLVLSSASISVAFNEWCDQINHECVQELVENNDDWINQKDRCMYYTDENNDGVCDHCNHLSQNGYKGQHKGRHHSRHH